MLRVSGNCVVPVVVWGSTPPLHTVTSLLVSPEWNQVVTGGLEGHMITWDVKENWQFQPKLMLQGHKGCITNLCLAGGGKDGLKAYFVSASDTGELALWDWEEGVCLEYKVDSRYVHTQVVSHQPAYQSHRLLFCCGRYPEISVLQAMGLTPLYTLVSRAHPNWLSAVTVFTHPQEKHDVVLGVSVAGAVTVWTLNGLETHGEPKEENESKLIKCRNVMQLACCPDTPRTVLLVSPTELKIYDAVDWCLLSSQENPHGDPFVGGEFLTLEVVIVFGRSGRAYLYRLPSSASVGHFDFRREIAHSNPPLLFAILNSPNAHPMNNCDGLANGVGDHPTHDIAGLHLGHSVFCVVSEDQRGRFLIGGDTQAALSVWRLSEKLLEGHPLPSGITPEMTTSLVERWQQATPHDMGAIFQSACPQDEVTTITSSIMLHGEKKMALGLSTGDIVVVDTVDLVTAQLLVQGKGPPCHVRLVGHVGPVRSLLHPASTPTPDRSLVDGGGDCVYDAHYLVSGGEDFSVRIWDLKCGSLITTLHMHAGVITALYTTPEGGSGRLSGCVVSIAEDHSLAVVSLRERRAILQSGHQRSPIVSLGWRPSEDFLLVSCLDASVLVWEVGAGMLDRHETGQVGQDLLDACPVIVRVRNPRGQLLGMGMKRSRNLRRDSPSRHGLHPLIVQSCKDAQLLYWDTESIIVNVSSEAHSRSANKTKSNHRVPLLESGFHLPAKSYAELLEKNSTDVTDKAPLTRQPVSSSKGKSETTLNGGLSESTSSSGSESSHCLSVHLAHLLASLLHPWDVDPGLDRACKETLGLVKPALPLCFGTISRHNCLALMLPGWLQPEEGSYPRAYWTVSSSLTTQHLLSLMGLAQALTTLPDEAFRDWPRLSDRRIDSSSDESGQNRRQLLDGGVAVKQVWLLVATNLCTYLADLLSGPGRFKPPQVQIFAHKWQDRCLPIREAAQTLLHSALDRLGSEGRKSVVDHWSAHLPALSVLDNSLPADNLSMASLDSTENGGLLLLDAGWWTHGPGCRLSVREEHRLQAASIVMLGVIGARYGNNASEESEHACTVGCTAVGSSVQEGFGLDNYHLARCTCRVLTALVMRTQQGNAEAAASSTSGAPSPHPSLTSDLQPSVSKPRREKSLCSTSHSALVRAGVDLLGRGFAVWEPYLDLGHLLNTLLECARHAKHRMERVPPGHTLPPHVDIARTARQALRQIASSRPKAYVITLAREVLRYHHQLHASGNTSVNAGVAGVATGSVTLSNHGNDAASPALLAAKEEIVGTLEMLCEKKANELVDVFAEVVDILLLCLDKKALRDRGLDQLFPPIRKFCTVANHTRAQKVCVGGRNGLVSFYDYKLGKYHTNLGHKAPVTALAFSSDGKQLASYSIHDNLLRIWQPWSTGLFGLGGQQVKLVTSHAVPPPANRLPPGTVISTGPMQKNVWIEWPDTRTVQLLGGPSATVLHRLRL